ncbi:MAG: chloride channel protein [Candidatus Dormibacteria bacterium]
MQPNVPADRGVGGFSARFWGVVVLTGVGAGLGGIAFILLLHAVQHVAYGYRSGSFQSGVAPTSAERRVVVMAAAGVFAGAAWWLLRRITGGGTGLSEAVWEKAGKLPLIATIVNAVLQIVVVGVGATLGREGAPKETGAAIASQLSDRCGLTPSQRRILVACGAGAGMAAVYNVPLGGALFALEVLLGSLSLPLVLPALATSAIATAVSWLVLPAQPTYQVPGYGVSATQIVWAALLGPVAGFVAVAYIRLIAWAKASTPQGWRLVGSTTVVFSTIGAVAIIYPEVLGNGKDVTQFAFVDQLGLPLLGALLIIRPLATASCLRAGAVGGLFTPTLTFGALFGGFLGHLWSALWPGAPLGSYAMIGAAAVLAAAMQSPLASIVLVLELAGGGLPLLVPMLVAVSGATIVCRALDDRSIYSAPLRRRRDSSP